MKEFNTFIHNKTAKLIQYNCFKCNAYLCFVSEIKDSGKSTCTECGTNHKVSVFKKGSIGISILGK